MRRQTRWISLCTTRLRNLGFEAEEISFADELKTMAVFSTDKEDDERLKTYILERVPPTLKSDLETYILHRTATFAARTAREAQFRVSQPRQIGRPCFAYLWLHGSPPEDPTGCQAGHRSALPCRSWETLFRNTPLAQTGTPAFKRASLRDATALSLLSLISPDRVGCIRKLRLGHTLKRKEGGGWMMDLSRQRCAVCEMLADMLAIHAQASL